MKIYGKTGYSKSFALLIISAVLVVSYLVTGFFSVFVVNAVSAMLDGSLYISHTPLNYLVFWIAAILIKTVLS